MILVSAQGPILPFSFFGGTFIQVGGLFGQGLGLRLGPGLDNFFVSNFFMKSRPIREFIKKISHENLYASTQPSLIEFELKCLGSGKRAHM